MPPAEISPRARKEWVCLMGMAPAQIPRASAVPPRRSRISFVNRYSAGKSTVHPASSVRWGIIMSHNTLDQRRFSAG